MDLTPYVESVRRDLLQAAALGDENTQRTASALAAAVEPSIRLAMMNALAQMAGEITGELQSSGDVTVDVRLEGNEVKVSVSRPVDHEPGTDGTGFAPDTEGGWGQAMKDAGSELSRTTVRLFQDLKNQAESAASDQGVSLNTYISRAVSESVKGGDKSKQSRRPGNGRSSSGWIRT
ncbi:MAG: toxin-antitoxin system HicB family antitoxin [Nakamurella sp.]